jgi:mevalonate kinase
VFFLEPVPRHGAKHAYLWRSAAFSPALAMFPAKLLLFGEHLLLTGAPALAVPVPAFAGDWAWRAAGAAPDAFVASLAAFAASDVVRSVDGLNYEAFQRELAQGLYFASTIPTGYGLGSSGALCAAVYARYARTKRTGLGELRVELAALERFFHGTSSGIDPLTSYSARPLLLRGPADAVLFEGEVWREPPVIFLLDTGQPRQTRALVGWFREQSQTDAFGRVLAQAMVPAHLAVLDAWQHADSARFWPVLRRFSELQWRYLKPMVAPIEELWRQSLDENEFIFKLCGTGGGGFVLGFARRRDAVASLAERYPVYFPFDVATQLEG